MVNIDYPHTPTWTNSGSGMNFFDLHVLLQKLFDFINITSVVSSSLLINFDLSKPTIRLWKPSILIYWFGIDVYLRFALAAFFKAWKKNLQKPSIIDLNKRSVVPNHRFRLKQPRYVWNTLWLFDLMITRLTFVVNDNT